MSLPIREKNENSLIFDVNNYFFLVEIIQKVESWERFLKTKFLFFVGLLSFFWLVFRTGTKPTRLTYPCQQAALTNVSNSMSAVVPLAVTPLLLKIKNIPINPIFTRIKEFIRKKWKQVLALTIIVPSVVIASGLLWSSLLPNIIPNGNGNHYEDTLLNLESNTASAFPASDIFVVNGRTVAHIPELVNLMGSHGSFFYRSSVSGLTQGPNGLIASDDVVLLKTNSQWPCRGGTNTDLLRELIQAIVNHPDGFAGEIVVADNGQGYGSLDWEQNNAENYGQSAQDVVNQFSSLYRVSTFDWQPIRGTRVSEYSQGDLRNGYILYDTPDPETGIYVSYPKFQTSFGTYISFKNGIWNGVEYDDRLKVINLPVLKSHWSYGVTASIKHYMGVQSEGDAVSGGLANGHVSIARGGMGTLMVETGLPTLNIIDAIWINANPYPSISCGPETHYSEATRVNILLASTDPVALDYWASKHVLVQAAEIIGYGTTHTIDPDNMQRYGLEEAFGVYLNRSKNEILSAGYSVTTSEYHMNVYVYQPNHVSIPLAKIAENEGWTNIPFQVNMFVYSYGLTAVHLAEFSPNLEILELIMAYPETKS